MPPTLDATYGRRRRGEELPLTSFPASGARKRFAAILNEVEFSSQRVVLERNGRPVAAVVPFEDLELLDLSDNRMDLEAARAALREPDPNVSWQALRTELDL